MTEKVIKSFKPEALQSINLILADVNDYKAPVKYNFIVMGEVMEHVENPGRILHSLSTMLAENGRLFITTCINSPAIDHVFHFTSVDHVRSVIEGANWEIDDEILVPSERKNMDYIIKNKIDISYAAMLKKKRGNE